MIVIFMSFLWVDGLALYPFVILKSTNPPAYLLNHERIHLRQQLEMGLLLFYVWYVVEFVLRYGQYKNADKAYRNICFEREAYAHDEQLDYLKNRKFWNFLKYI
jgi:hypothetical protein